jgi:hypothetical protein
MSAARQKNLARLPRQRQVAEFARIQAATTAEFRRIQLHDAVALTAISSKTKRHGGWQREVISQRNHRFRISASTLHFNMA